VCAFDRSRRAVGQGNDGLLGVVWRSTERVCLRTWRIIAALRAIRTFLRLHRLCAQRGRLRSWTGCRAKRGAVRTAAWCSSAAHRVGGGRSASAVASVAADPRRIQSPSATAASAVSVQKGL